MHRSFLLLTALLSGFVMSGNAQVNPAKPKPSTSAPVTTAASTDDGFSPAHFLQPADTNIEKRLVALALAGPTFDASYHQNRINELDLRRAKSAWLNLLTVSTSYYDQSGNKSNGNTTYVIPKYYFSLSIPLGIIFSQGNQIKTARESMAMTKDRQEDLARTLKAEVLGKYKQYRNYGFQVEMQNEMINDVLATSSQIEDQFKKGQVTVDVYIASQKGRNEELSKLMGMHLNQDLIKLDIEKMIGVPLESVLNHTNVAPAIITPGAKKN